MDGDGIALCFNGASRGIHTRDEAYSLESTGE